VTLRRTSPRAGARWSLLVGAVVALSVVFATATLANLNGSPFDGADGNLVLNDETRIG
jgi:hypothetical protein